MTKWRCTVCGYIYDPEEGDPESEILPGTPFEELRSDWVCPICNASKDQFEKVEQTEDKCMCKQVVIGAPTYHHDMTSNIKNFLEKVAFQGVNLKGKIGEAFGSYGQSGEAPRLVLEIMKNKFEMRVVEPSLLLKYATDPAGLEKCREFGRKIAEGSTLPTLHALMGIFI